VGPKGVWSGMPALSLALRFFHPHPTADFPGSIAEQHEPVFFVFRGTAWLPTDTERAVSGTNDFLVALSLRHQTRVHPFSGLCLSRKRAIDTDSPFRLSKFFKPAT
jgi:hypothetical protein